MTSGAAAQALDGAARAPAPRPVLMVLAASAGNALEFYDFTVFGYFAPQISAAFFPEAGHGGRMLATWGAFFTAFLARPLGAFVLGSVADRHGRKISMTLSIALMTLGTLALAATPGFATIGWAAPLLIIAGRLAQGFSAGGEYGGATAFMLEHGRGRRGLTASFQFISQAVSSMAGSGAAFLTASLLSASALAHWGFRLPFAAGLLIVPVGLYLRQRAEETPVFQAAAHSDTPALDAMRHYPGRVLIGACAVAAGTSGTYVAIYLPSFAQQQLHMTATSSFAVPLIGSAISLVATPVSAHLSDRLGRLVPALICGTLFAAFAYPAFLLVNAAPHFGMLMGVMAVLIALRSSYSAPLPALLGEIFPPGVRGVGMSVAYSLGVTLFGGLTPLICDWLIRSTGNRTMPGVYLAGCGLVSVASLLFIARKVRLERA